MKPSNHVYIDIFNPRKNIVHLVQDDSNTWNIVLHLAANGIAYHIARDIGSATLVPYVKYVKPNGMSGTYDETSTGLPAVSRDSQVDSDVWTVNIDQHVTNVPGFVDLFVTFSLATGETLHIFPITLDVYRSSGESADPDQPYYHNSTFVLAGAQATKTAAMTQGVGIDANGKLWVAPGGSGGAGLLVVTLNSQNVPDASSSDVYDAWNSGSVCKLRTSVGIEYDLQSITTASAIFSTTIDTGSAVQVDSYTLTGLNVTHDALIGYVKPAGGIPGTDLSSELLALIIGAGAFVVTFTPSAQSVTADKTYDEVMAANRAGKVIIGQHGDRTFYFIGDPDDDGATFIRSFFNDAGQSMSKIVLADDESVSTETRLLDADSVRYTAQTLTDTQQAQARGNIGADWFTSDSEVPGGTFEPVDMSSGVTITDGENWRQAGHSGSAENWWRTNKLAVVPGYTYRFVNFPLYMYQYDSTGGNGVSGQLNSEHDATYTVPAGIYFIGFYQQHPVKTGIQMFRVTPTPEEESATENVVKADGLSLMVSNIKRDSTAKMLCPLKGKKIVQFGDSIIGKFSTPEDVSTYLADLSGATVYNCGFGGSKMATHANANYALFSFHALIDAVIADDFSAQDAALASSWEAPAEYAERLATLKAVDWSTVDIVTISYGTNDWMSAIAIDNSSNLKDKTTYLGSFRYGVEKLLTAYPRLRIYPTTPIYRTHLDDTTHAYIENSDTWTNASGKTIPDYCDALMAVSETYKFMCVDNYWQTGFNELTRTLYFRPNDGTHPSVVGREIIAQNIFNGMMSSGAMGYGGNAKGYLTLADLPIYNGGVS